MNDGIARTWFSPALALLVALLALAPIGLKSQAVLNKEPDSILVPDGTPVHLVLMDDLQGKQVHVKQVVHFKVRADVVVNSNSIVKTGALAIGHIEAVSKSGLFGKSGRLVLQFDYVESVSGARISLRGGTGVNGGKGGALTLESAMWYGPNANLPVGTIVNAFINHDQRVPTPKS